VILAGAPSIARSFDALSVGEAKALRSLGIDVVENLPALAKLQDMCSCGVVFTYKGNMPDRRPTARSRAEGLLVDGLRVTQT